MRHLPSQLVLLFVVLLTLSLLGTEIAAKDVADSFTATVRPLLEEHCYACHGGADEPAGELDLSVIRNVADLDNRLDLVQQLIDVLESREMPPEEEAELPDEQRRQLITQLGELLRAAASQTAPPPAEIRRMTRFQYNNAVYDLFQLNVEVFSLPERTAREYENYFQPDAGKMPEEVNVGSRPLGKSQLIEDRLVGVNPYPQDLRAEHGFDNRADHLTISPMLMESFLQLGRSIVNSSNFNEKTCGVWASLFAPPDEAVSADLTSVVRQRLRGFLTSAFRRPVDERDLERYTQFAVSRINAGESFTDGMKSVAAAALASPRFLYLYSSPQAANSHDQRPPADEIESAVAHDAASRDFAIAARLSFFLWGSIPNETLLNLAADGSLHEPETLVEQTNRMLRDERVKRFCDSFPMQWLQLERIISSFPDREKYPEFYFTEYNASMHMMLEPLLLFETVLVEDLSILQLIDANFSYRSNLLKSWYESGTHGPLESPYVLKFTRVPITDRRQGGVITNAAVMTMTSSNVQTKPITRGAWLAAVILNDPPEPPPANVPPLTEATDDSDQELTLRERFAVHRERADCAACHKSIDPLGFALENYNAVGVWRDAYENGQPVEPGGELFGSYPFHSVIEFKDVLLAEKNRFTRALAAHLLEFATGRQVSARDTVALDKIVANTAAADYGMKELIRQVVLSNSFTGYPRSRADGK